MRAARLAKGAVDALVGDLRLAAGCVTKHLLTTTPNQYDPDLVHAIAFGTGAAVPLRGVAGPSGLLFSVRQHYQINQSTTVGHDSEWQVTTTAYDYRLLDRDDRELLVFHWQPGPGFHGPDYPHLHVSASLRARISATEEQSLPLDKRHVPTGWITLADIVRMLITEFEIRPIVPNWEQRLHVDG